MTEHDDMVDALAMAVQFIPGPPPSSTFTAMMRRLDRQVSSRLMQEMMEYESPRLPDPPKYDSDKPHEGEGKVTYWQPCGHRHVWSGVLGATVCINEACRAEHDRSAAQPATSNLGDLAELLCPDT